MNNENVYRQIYANPRFQELMTKRGRFAWALAILMLAAYYSFILLVAFSPKTLGATVVEGGVVSWGIVVGLGLIFTCFILTGIYVQRANGEFDRITQQILDEVQK